jgi:hypothetical protein
MRSTILWERDRLVDSANYSIRIYLIYCRMDDSVRWSITRAICKGKKLEEWKLTSKDGGEETHITEITGPDKSRYTIDQITIDVLYNAVFSSRADARDLVCDASVINSLYENKHIADGFIYSMSEKLFVEITCLDPGPDIEHEIDWLGDLFGS